MYRYIRSRYFEEIEDEYDTLDEALESAWDDSEFENAYPLDIYEGDKLLLTNRGSVPWSDDNPGTLNLKLSEMSKERD